MSERGFSWLALWVSACHGIPLWCHVLHFYSNLGNENSDAVQIKCSRGPQAPAPALEGRMVKIFLKNSVSVDDSVV